MWATKSKAVPTVASPSQPALNAPSQAAGTIRPQYNPTRTDTTANEPVDDNPLHGIPTAGADQNEHRQYIQLADALGVRLQDLLTREQLQGLRTELLVLMIRLRREEMPLPLQALMTRLLKAAHHASLGGK